MQRVNSSKPSTGGQPLGGGTDVEQTNYRTFLEARTKLRSNLAKAIDADEKNSYTQRQLINMYRVTITSANIVLAIRPEACPRCKRSEVEQYQKTARKFSEDCEARIRRIKETSGPSTLGAGTASQPSGSGCDTRKPKNNQTAAIPNDPRPPRERNIPVIVRNPPTTYPSKTTTTTGASHRTTCHNAASAHYIGCGQQRLTEDQLLHGVGNATLGQEILNTILDFNPGSGTGPRLIDVLGNEAAKLALEESVILPAQNPKLFTGLRTPAKGILLFGPPGNGKTLIAKAVAHECQATFFSISSATIMSKWVGEGEKLVQTLFHVARNAQPSIIFIDEVDSMLCERSKDESGASRRILTEFLVQLDGVSSRPEDRVLVLGATNRPFDLDEGILRRFPQRIFIDLPDREARAIMLRATFQQHKTVTTLGSREFERVAILTDNYSYSDLMALCRAAAMQPVQAVRRQQQPGAALDFRNISERQLPPVRFDDLAQALKQIRPSGNPENRARLAEFAANYAFASTAVAAVTTA